MGSLSCPDLRHQRVSIADSCQAAAASRPDITGGRVSLVIFFYPDADNLERQWQTITEEDDEGKSTVTDASALPCLTSMPMLIIAVAVCSIKALRKRRKLASESFSKLSLM